MGFFFLGSQKTVRENMKTADLKSKISNKETVSLICLETLV